MRNVILCLFLAGCTGQTTSPERIAGPVRTTVPPPDSSPADDSDWYPATSNVHEGVYNLQEVTTADSYGGTTATISGSCKYEVKPVSGMSFRMTKQFRDCVVDVDGQPSAASTDTAEFLQTFSQNTSGELVSVRNEGGYTITIKLLSGRFTITTANQDVLITTQVYVKE